VNADLTLLYDPEWKSQVIPAMDRIDELAGYLVQSPAPTERTRPIHDAANGTAFNLALMATSFKQALEPETVDAIEVAVGAIANATNNRQETLEAISAVCTP